MKNLRTLRKSKKLTMKKFGEIFDLAECTISLYELGKRQPDNDTMKKIADYFGVTVDYLLGRDTPTQENPLTANEKTVLDLFNQVPADKQDLVLQMIKVAIENSK